MIKEVYNLQKPKFFYILAIISLLALFPTFSKPINLFIVNHLSNKNIVSAEDKLIVHFISVGEADATAINFPNGEVAIIDTGLDDYTTELIDYLQDNVISRKKDKTIDYMFITHADSDHTGGAVTILDLFNVEKVIRSRQYVEFEEIDDSCFQIVKTETYIELIDKIYATVGEENLITAVDGMHYDIGETSVDIFYPLVEFSDSNDYSYFIKISYRGNSILVAGDATEKTEKIAVNEYYDSLDCDIFKVNHHGSSSSNSEDFLNIISPEYAVISCGNNNYGHPSDVVLERLDVLGCEIFRTDEQGNIMAVVDENIDFYYGGYYISRLDFNYLTVELLLTIILICIFVLDIIKLVHIKKRKDSDTLDTFLD